jgi:hypothetical protein
MALGLTFSNGKPASMARGRYSTRNNRVVEITGSHEKVENVGGLSTTKIIWDGIIFEANGKNVESTATWSNDGRYLHNEGVGSSFDLSIVISQEAEPEPAVSDAAPAVLENQLAYAALCQALTPHMRDGETGSQAIVRIVRERDEQSELLSHIREVLVPQLKEGETATAGITRIIEERDAAIVKLKELRAL